MRRLIFSHSDSKKNVLRSGFTLLELLVTITIVGVLIGVLLPALSGMSGSSRRVHCLSNLRQLGIAATMYTHDFRCYPPALRYESDPFAIIAWDFQQIPATGETSPGELWAYADVAAGEVHQCPAFHGSATFGADPHTGYNYNTTYVGGEALYGQNWDSPDYRQSVRPSECRSPATTALFGDGGWAGGANKFMRAPMNTVEANLASVYGGGQAFRHRGTSNVVYLDGHCDSTKTSQPGELATDELLNDVMNFPSNGFLSDNDGAYDLK